MTAVAFPRRPETVTRSQREVGWAVDRNRFIWVRPRARPDLISVTRTSWATLDGCTAVLSGLKPLSTRPTAICSSRRSPPSRET